MAAEAGFSILPFQPPILMGMVSTRYANDQRNLGVHLDGCNDTMLSIGIAGQSKGLLNRC